LNTSSNGGFSSFPNKELEGKKKGTDRIIAITGRSLDFILPGYRASNQNYEIKRYSLDKSILDLCFLAEIKICYV
jgi:hypothetical protein